MVAQRKVTMLHMSATIAYIIEAVKAHPDWFEEGALEYYEGRRRAGDRLVPTGACEGFDPQTGCPGHGVHAEKAGAS